jgi:hypothetical protein
MSDALKSSYVVLGLTALVVVGMFLLAALGRMDAQLAVGSAVSFVMGVLTAWKRGVTPEPTE